MPITDPGTSVARTSHGDPWRDSSRDCLKIAKRLFPCDALLLGAYSAQGAADETLVSAGFNANLILRWMSAPTGLFQAGDSHCAIIAAGQRDMPNWLSSHHAIVAVLNDACPATHRWCLVAARRRRLFNEMELARAALQLRRWQNRFHFPRQTALRRLLLGADHRLIDSDHTTQELLLDQPYFIDELVTQLRLIVDQRYAKLRNDEQHDFVESIAGKTQWIRFQRRAAFPSNASCQWYIEIRPIDDEDLPPAGAVSDERIADALALMHDTFDQTPNLQQIARHVHMSPFHLHRLFSKHIGTSPKRYLLHWQLNVGKWLLRDPMVPVSSIATDTGFTSHGHFTATFHRLVGVSPTEYRAANAF